MSSQTIEFSFGFDLSQLQSGANKAQALVARSMGRISAGTAVAFGAAAGAVSEAFAKIAEIAHGTAEKVKGVFEQGAALNSLSQQTGIAAGRLYQMSAAFKRTDVDASKLGPAINRLQLHLAAAANGNKAASTAFNNLGLAFEKLIRLTPDKQFQAVAAAIAALPTPTARAADSMALFGRAGAELLPLFNTAGAVASMGGKLSSSAQVFAENSEQFHEAAANLRKVGTAFNGFYRGLAAGLVESFNDTLKKAGAADFVASGKQAGEAIGAVMRFVGMIWENIGKIGNIIEGVFSAVVGDSLQVAEILWKGIQMMANGLEAGFQSALSNASSLIADLIKMPMVLAQKLSAGLIWAFEQGKEFFGNGMWDVIASIAAGLSAAVDSAISSVISHLPAALKKILHVENYKPESYSEYKKDFEGGVAGKKSGYKAESFGDIDQRIGTQMRSAIPGYYGAADKMRDAAKEHADKMTLALNRPLAGFTDFFAPAAWHGVADTFFKAAAEPIKKAAEAGAAKPAKANDPWAAFRAFKTFDGPHVQGAAGGLGNGHNGLGGAYGLVRHGDAARRRATEKEAEKKAKETAAGQSGDSTQLAEGIDGSNERLDTLIGIFGGKS